jgi:hypothetical protein
MAEKRMNTTLFLQKQLSNIHSVFQEIVGNLNDQEWTSRPVPGQNLPGYTAWHLPRTQDNFVQTWIRGIPEVVHSERWMHWQRFKRFGIGAGITVEEADEIAHTVNRADVLAYADDVHHEIIGWLNELDENSLDHIPEAARHLSLYPEYQTPGFHKDTDSLLNQPEWALLMRPCIGHVHRHLGELQAVKVFLQTNK